MPPFDDYRQRDGSHRPRHVQIREGLIKRLALGEWRAGDPLPGESRLAAEYDVAQGTMRKAIDHLVQQNLLVRRQGKGTYVTTHDRHRTIFHFNRLVANDGSHDLPSAIALWRRKGAANHEEARRLKLAAGVSVFRLTRLRSSHARPVIVERIVLPERLFPRFGAGSRIDIPQLLYEFYEREYGVLVVEALEEIRATEASGREAELLGLPTGSPLLEISRVALTFGEQPVEWRVSRCETRHQYYLNRFT